jgi:hypothetical protein
MARIIRTRERLRSLLDKDRRELAEFQEASKDEADEAISPTDRFAKNMALIRSYESQNEQ